MQVGAKAGFLINRDARALVADMAALERALAEADPATLLMALVQLTGDLDRLAQARPFIAGPMSYQEAMPEPMRTAIREALKAVLLDYAKHDRPWLTRPFKRSRTEECNGAEIIAKNQ